MKTIKMDIGHPILIAVEYDSLSFIYEKRWAELNERINSELPKNRWVSPFMLDLDKEHIALRAYYFCEQDVMYEPKVFGKSKGYTDFRPDLDEIPLQIIKQFLKDCGYEVTKIDIRFNEGYDIDINWHSLLFPKEANWEKEVKKIDDITLRQFGTV